MSQVNWDVVIFAVIDVNYVGMVRFVIRVVSVVRNAVSAVVMDVKGLWCLVYTTERLVTVYVLNKLICK